MAENGDLSYPAHVPPPASFHSLGLEQYRDGYDTDGDGDRSQESMPVSIREFGTNSSSDGIMKTALCIGSNGVRTSVDYLDDVAVDGDDDDDQLDDDAIDRHLEYTRQKARQRNIARWTAILALFCVVFVCVAISAGIRNQRTTASSRLGQGFAGYRDSNGATHSSSSDKSVPGNSGEGSTASSSDGIYFSGSSSASSDGIYFSGSSSASSDGIYFSGSSSDDTDVIFIDQFIEDILRNSRTLNEAHLDSLPDNEWTPQYRAVEHMTTKDQPFLRSFFQTQVSGLSLREALKTATDDDIDIITERYAVIVLYYALDGPNWETNDEKPVAPFLTDKSVCNWNTAAQSQAGIFCDEDGWIQTIDLAGHGLIGQQIPTEIGVLTSARNVFLASNNIAGTIPTEIGMMQSLERLYLEQNRLTGSVPEELGSLEHLLAVRLDHNDLSGSMDNTLCANNKIHSIEADCGGDNPEIECFCCLACFDDGGDA